MAFSVDTPLRLAGNTLHHWLTCSEHLYSIRKLLKVLSSFPLRSTSLTSFAQRLPFSPASTHRARSSMVNAPTLDPIYAAPLVSFSLDQTSSESTSRLGTLTLTPREDVPTVLQTIKTPSLIANAPRGAVTHLTPDNLRRCDSTAVHLSLEHL